MICVNHLLVVANCSFNFLIYLMASKSQNRQNCCTRLLNNCLGLRRQKEPPSSGVNNSHSRSELHTTVMTASAVGAGGTPGASYNPNSTLRKHNPPTEAAGTPQSAVTSVLLKVTDCD